MPPPEVRTATPRPRASGPGPADNRTAARFDPNVVPLAARLGAAMPPSSAQHARNVAASVPGRTHALIPGGNLPAIAPPSPDALALGVLVECRGDRVATELVDALAFIRGKLAALGQAVAGGDLGAMTRLPELVSLHAAYLARYQAVSQLTGQSGELIAPVALAGLATHLTTHPSREGIAEAIALTRRALVGVETELAAVRRILADDDAYAAYVVEPHNLTSRGAQDTALDRLATLLATQRELTAKIERLESDQVAMTKVVAERVQAAVQAAGGMDRVVESVKAAILLAKRGPDVMLGQLRGAVAAADAEHAALTRDLDALAGAGLADGPVASDIKTRLAEATTRLAEARQALGHAHGPSAHELVNGAMEGLETARKELEALTAAAGRVFATGFGQAIASAEFSRAALQELAQALAG